jgi:hypothetical protein
VIHFLLGFIVGWLMGTAWGAWLISQRRDRQ